VSGVLVAALAVRTFADLFSALPTGAIAREWSDDRGAHCVDVEMTVPDDVSTQHDARAAASSRDTARRLTDRPLLPDSASPRSAARLPTFSSG
jgi:hypothetical protein